MDRIWLWVYDNKIPIYPIFYLVKVEHRVLGGLEVSSLGFLSLGFTCFGV